MKKILTIFAVIIFINANAQTTTTFARNGFAKPDSSSTPSDSTIGSNAQCFSTAVNYPAGVYVGSIITTDFNNDGKAFRRMVSG